jgi:ubiquinone/menaquinone biosynthesis C-methylase UbiE
VETTNDFDRLHKIWRHATCLEISPFHFTRKRLIMDAVATSVKPGSSVLDVGCGIGDLLVSLAEQGVAADGTDVARFALNAAKRRLSHTDLVLSDARWLPFRGDNYSVVICSEVLEHVEDHAKVAEEIHRVLVPGGTAVLTVPHGEQHWTWEDRVDGHLRRYTKKQFSDLMREAGFEIDEIRCWGFPLAVLFRKVISTPLYDRGFHESQSCMKNSVFYRALLRSIVMLFRLDDSFHGSQLGLGIVARLRKPIASPGTTANVKAA